MVVTDTDLEHVVDVQLVDSLQRHVQVGRAQRRRDEELDARGRLQTLQAEGARLEAVDAARARGRRQRRDGVHAVEGGAQAQVVVRAQLGRRGAQVLLVDEAPGLVDDVQRVQHVEMWTGETNPRFYSFRNDVRNGYMNFN